MNTGNGPLRSRNTYTSTCAYMLQAYTCTHRMAFDVHVLSCRTSFGCVVWICWNLIAFLIDCLAFVRSVPVGTVCVVFGATHAGAEFALSAIMGSSFVRF